MTKDVIVAVNAGMHAVPVNWIICLTFVDSLLVESYSFSGDGFVDDVGDSAIGVEDWGFIGFGMNEGIFF